MPLIKLLRPSHWIKNLFVFMPLFFGHQLFNVPLLVNTIIMFFAFSFTASAIYCLNDIIDVEDDRRHPVKCQRPVASGVVSVSLAYTMMAIMISLSICVLSFSSIGYLAGVCVIVGYFLMEVAYCLRLKRYAIIDICLLSMGFVFRIIAGGVVTHITVSHWLVMMTFLLTLFLGIAKRRDDVLKMKATGVPPRHNTKRYNLTFVNNAVNITGAVMLVCYIMYTVSPEVKQNFHTDYLYLTSLFVLIGLLRYIQLAVVDDKTGDPTKVILHDRFMQVDVIAWGITFLLIIYW